SLVRIRSPRLSSRDKAREKAAEFARVLPMPRRRSIVRGIAYFHDSPKKGVSGWSWRQSSRADSPFRIRFCNRLSFLVCVSTDEPVVVFDNVLSVSELNTRLHVSRSLPSRSTARE